MNPVQCCMVFQRMVNVKLNFTIWAKVLFQEFFSGSYFFFSLCSLSLKLMNGILFQR